MNQARPITAGPSGRTMSARVGGTDDGAANAQRRGVDQHEGDARAVLRLAQAWLVPRWTITSPAFVLAELPAGTRAVILAGVDGPADELTFAALRT